MRGASRSSSIRGAGCGWPLRCRTPNLVEGRDILERTGTDAGATGGRSKCMSGRQLARTGARRRKRQPLGHGANREIHSRAERRRRTASEARFSSTIYGVGLDHCPCAAKAACGMPASKQCGRRGRGETPCRSARPFGQGKATGDRRTPSRTGRGAMTCVWASAEPRTHHLNPHPEEPGVA